MALIKCPECGREISDKAKACPHCGCPVENFKSDGIVKIQMPRNDAGTLNLFGGFNTCTITDQETQQELWRGHHGQIAEFHMENKASVIIEFGNLSNPLECIIDPKDNPKYLITQDMGMHLKSTYNISRVDIIDSK